MSRPRRPILAAVCAALLLATVALWVASANRTVAIECGVTVVIWPGAIEVVTDRPPWGRGIHIYSSAGAEWQWAPTWYPSHYVSLPLWVFAGAFAAGLWWSWRRGRQAGAGFPIQAVNSTDDGTPAARGTRMSVGPTRRCQ